MSVFPRFAIFWPVIPVTDFEKVLLSGIGYIRTGCTIIRSEGKDGHGTARGRESLLVRDSSEPILQNLADRLALFTYDKVETRSVVVTGHQGGVRPSITLPPPWRADCGW